MPNKTQDNEEMKDNPASTTTTAPLPTPLRVVQIYAENFKKLKVVDIRPDPSDPIVLLTGKNRQGKSSLLECLWGMLLGEKHISADIIRDGTDRAEGLIDFGDYLVKRVINRKEGKDGSPSGGYTTTLSIIGKGGFIAPSPQEFLSSRLGENVQDPIAFNRLSESEKIETLQRLITFRPDPDEFMKRSGFTGVKAEHLRDSVGAFDRAHKKLFELRKEVNAEVKRLEGVKASFTPPEGWESVEEVKVKDLFEERKALEERRTAQDDERKKARDYQTLIIAQERRINEREFSMQDIAEQIADLQRALDVMKTEQEAHRIEVTNMLNEHAAMEQHLTTLEDLTPLFQDVDTRISTADATNKTFNAITSWKASTTSLETQRAVSQSYTDRMAALKNYKGELIEAAGMPVLGLGFDEGVVTYNGHPLSLASGAEQIHVGCAVCMASHPDIGLLTIDKAWAELDLDSQRVLREWAAKIGAHIIVTKVAEQPEENGWHLVEGEVVAVNGVPVEGRPEKPEALEDKRKKRGKGGSKKKGGEEGGAGNGKTDEEEGGWEEGASDPFSEEMVAASLKTSSDNDLSSPAFLGSTDKKTPPSLQGSELPPRLSRKTADSEKGE